ncbi:hypothetical protein D3C71_1803690 [compost metagenome]
MTVCKAMSITSPSAFWLGISIQSPMRTRPSPLICTLATSDRMVSWKINMNTAVAAPRPVIRCNSSTPTSTATMDRPATTNTTILATCR